MSRDLPRLASYLTHLANALERHADEPWRCRPLVSAIVELDRAVPDRAGIWLEWLLSYQDALTDTPHEDYVTGWTLPGCVQFGLAIADGNLLSFQDPVRAAVRHRLGAGPFSVDADVAALHRCPALRPVLARNLTRHPRRCLDLLERLAQAPRLGTASPAPLAALGAAPTAKAAIPPEWQNVLDAAPGLAPLALRYLHAQHLRGADADVPPGVRHALERPRTLACELAHLEQLLAEQPDLPRQTHLALRADRLRAQLSGPHHESLPMTARADAEERLGGLADEAELAAAEHGVLEPFRARLRTLVGAPPSGVAIPLSDDLLNGIALAGEIRSNRRLLLQLLRAYVAGDHRWPESHPANVSYLDGLRGRGVDVLAWLGDHRRAYRCGGVAGGRVRLRVERDPLRILQMGNLFGTCLSYSAYNAFSTVANACELNKRVIYAYDGHGRVVGRKLIGVERTGRLVGFRTYTSLDDKEGNAQLRVVVRDYARRFAAACRLELADEGEVPTLFASRWYDDGTVPWDDDSCPVLSKIV